MAVAAALMPDTQQGYSLPTSSVLATKNAVIPYAVDIGSDRRPNAPYGSVMALMLHPT